VPTDQKVDWQQRGSRQINTTGHSTPLTITSVQLALADQSWYIESAFGTKRSLRSVYTLRRISRRSTHDNGTHAWMTRAPLRRLSACRTVDGALLAPGPEHPCDFLEAK
jgi:hypothetical protein